MALLFIVIFFFFKQKTAYEMRISDWSSDVCSSDLFSSSLNSNETVPSCRRRPLLNVTWRRLLKLSAICSRDRKSVVSGKSVSVRVDLGGRRIIKKKKSK